MSFLDEQASGRIGIGEKADLGTLTRTRRKRKKGQRPQGTETYSLLPQNEFTDIVSSPTDIRSVGIGNLLRSQGASAASVRNVFEEYQDTGAAPIGELGNVLFPQPSPDDDDDLVTGSDPVVDAGLPDFGSLGPDDPNFQGTGLEVDDEGNPMAFGATGLTLAEDLENLKISAQKFFPFGKTGYETQDPETGGSGRMAPLPGKALGAYENYGNLPKGGTTGASGQGTGGRGGPILTPEAQAALGLTGQTTAFVDPPSVGPDGYSDSSGGDQEGPPATVDVGDGVSAEWSVGSMLASGGTVKSKNKNSFMSMKGK